MFCFRGIGHTFGIALTYNINTSKINRDKKLKTAIMYKKRTNAYHNTEVLVHRLRKICRNEGTRTWEQLSV